MPPRRQRRLAREYAMQFLFGLDFSACEWESAIETFWDTKPVRPGVKEYAESLIRGVHAQLESVDRAIEGALEHWSFDRMGAVERAILRIAVFEMYFIHDVPRRVAINEAIEIAKRFGADGTPGFVNGILDRALMD